MPIRVQCPCFKNRPLADIPLALFIQALTAEWDSCHAAGVKTNVFMGDSYPLISVDTVFHVFLQSYESHSIPC